MSEARTRFDTDSADLRRVIDEIRDGTYEPPPDLLALAEQICAQPPLSNEPEAVRAWAERLAASMIAADEVAP